LRPAIGSPWTLTSSLSHKFFIQSSQRSVDPEIGLVGDANNRERLDPMLF
jgi:hypothetical protein